MCDRINLVEEMMKMCQTLLLVLLDMMRVFEVPYTVLLCLENRIDLNRANIRSMLILMVNHNLDLVNRDVHHYDDDS